MNAYIKTDIENSILQMKVALMNVIHDIKEIKHINLGKYINYNLLCDCLKESGYTPSYFGSSGQINCQHEGHYDFICFWIFSDDTIEVKGGMYDTDCEMIYYEYNNK